GFAGRSAMLSAGSSKSKRSVRMAPMRSRDSGVSCAAAPEQEILSRVRRHPRLDDLVGILHRLAALDLVDVLHARGHLAPDRVLAVEEGGVVEADEELSVAGIRARRARHRGGAADMGLLVDLGLQLLAGAG